MLLPSVDTALDHIRRDAEAGRFAAWGQSTLIDESATNATAGPTAPSPRTTGGGSGTTGTDSGTTDADSGTTRGDSGTTLLERVTAAVLPALVSPPANAHSADVPVGDVITRVVALAPRPGTPSALIYGSAPASAPTDWRLITTFPVASDPATMVAECTAAPRLRFNAV